MKDVCKCCFVAAAGADSVVVASAAAAVVVVAVVAAADTASVAAAVVVVCALRHRQERIRFVYLFSGKRYLWISYRRRFKKWNTFNSEIWSCIFHSQLQLHMKNKKDKGLNIPWTEQIYTNTVFTVDIWNKKKTHLNVWIFITSISYSRTVVHKNSSPYHYYLLHWFVQNMIL